MTIPTDFPLWEEFGRIWKNTTLPPEPALCLADSTSSHQRSVRSLAEQSPLTESISSPLGSKLSFSELHTFSKNQIDKLLNAPEDSVNLINDDEEAFFATEEGLKNRYEEAILAYRSFLSDNYSENDGETLKAFLSIEPPSTFDLPDDLRKKIASLKCAKLGKIIWPNTKPSCESGDLIRMFMVLLDIIKSNNGLESVEKQNAINQFINFFAVNVIDKHCTACNSILNPSHSPFFSHLRGLNPAQRDQLDKILKKLYDPAKINLHQIIDRASVVKIDYIFRRIRFCIHTLEMESLVPEARAVMSDLAKDSAWFSDFPFSRALEFFCHPSLNDYKQSQEAVKNETLGLLVSCLHHRKKGHLPNSTNAAADLISFFKSRAQLKIIKNFQKLFCFQILDTLWLGYPLFSTPENMNYPKSLKVCTEILQTGDTLCERANKALSDFLWIITDYLSKNRLGQNDNFRELESTLKIDFLKRQDQKILKILEAKDNKNPLIRLRILDLIEVIADNWRVLIAGENDESVKAELSKTLTKLEENLPKSVFFGEWENCLSAASSKLPLISKAGKLAFFLRNRLASL